LGMDYTGEAWPRRVLEATGGRGADVVLEMAGGKVGTQSFECLASFGRMVIFGIASGKPAPIDPLALIFKNQSVIGFALTGLPGEQVSEAARELAGYVTGGKLRVLVGGTYPLEQAAEAHRAMGDRQTTGKLVLLP
ncbi:MAG: quinone oxidoreductase family protein, partial [Myxococcaceae bacterium]